MMKKLLLLLPLLLNADVAKVTQHFNVAITKVEKKRISYQKELYGYTAVDESRVYDVVPRFGGYIEKLYANKRYLRIKKGDALAKVYSPEVFKAKDELLQSYRYAQKRGDKAMFASAKLKLKLLDLPQSEIDAVIARQKDYEYTTIRSKYSGYLFEKSVSEGDAFKKTQKLFRVVDLSKLWVEVKVSDKDIAYVRDIKEFEVRFDGIEGVFIAKKELLYPKLSKSEALYTLRLILNNLQTKVFPQTYAKVLAKSDLGMQLFLPRSAVILKNGSYYVFLKTEFEGEFDVIKVKAKAVPNGYIILDGLKEGEAVAKSAMFMLDSDAQINSLY